MKRLASALAAGVGLASSTLSYAQGCALCYNTAAAAKASAIQALRSGILILIIPPLSICAGILWHGIRARNRFNEPEEMADEPVRELRGMIAQIESPDEQEEEDSGQLSVVSSQSQRASDD